MAAKGPNNLMRSRIVMLTLAFVAIGFGLVAVRLLYMQVFRNDFYVQQATTLQTRDTLVTPNRGTIYDANMQVLAESASVARITVNPKAAIDESKVNKGIPAEQQQQELAQILADTLELDYDTVLGKIKRTETQYQIIAQKVDKDTENALYEKLEAAGTRSIPSRTPSGITNTAPSFPPCWAMSTTITWAFTAWNPNTRASLPVLRGASSARRMPKTRICRMIISSTFRQRTETRLC